MTPFEAYDSLGLPMEDVFFAFKAHGWFPDLSLLVRQALSAGWSNKKIVAVVAPALFDVYGVKTNG